MDKSEAIRLLGGSRRLAAEAIGVSAQAVSQWPDKLPRRLVDRVQAALYRHSLKAASLPTAANQPTPKETRDAA